MSGPRTAAGRARSRANAMKHGLTGAGEVLLPDEDPTEDEKRSLALLHDLDPRGPVETVLAERIIGLFRRMRRFDRFESLLIQSHVDDGASLGVVALRDAVKAGFATLDRHEGALRRNLAATLAMLREARAARRRRQTMGASPARARGKIT